MSIQVTAASASAATGVSAGTLVVIQTVAHRYGYDLTPEAGVALLTLLVPVWHFVGTALGLLQDAVLNRLSKWANPPPAETPAVVGVK
jgi:hypothetical protein